MTQTVWDIFHMLLSSSAFSPSSSSILTKYEIFYDFWMKEVNWLRSQFDEHGDAKDGSQTRGFGFLVEEFARRSKRLPLGNTESGQRMADALLRALHEGDSDVAQLGRSQSQSDLLWVKQVGQRTTVIGIGEVKSSYEAFRKKTAQLSRQEKALKLISEKISGTNAHPFFQKKKVEIADELTKVLLVPSGEKERFQYKPEGWEITEIEFTHRELVFIAKLVWPYVWPSMVFGDNEVSSFWTFLSGEFSSLVKPGLDEILALTEEVPYWELGLFAWVTSKLPVIEEDRKLVVSMIQSLYWEALEYALRHPLDHQDLTVRERRFRDRFSIGNRKATLTYLGLARRLQDKITEEARKTGKVRTINNMLNLNLLEDLIPDLVLRK